MSPFLFATTAQILCESGSAARLAELCKECGAARVMIVTDPGITKLGMLDSITPGFAQAGVAYDVFDAVQADPPESVVMAAVEQARALKADLVVGFGGGSSMDVAKLVALLLGSDEDLDAAWGVGQAKGPRLPLVLIPTTAGTGSEVTPVSIITVGAEEKRGVSSPVILPDMAILDASLTVGLPAPITAATGVDAMVHAIESYASVNANNNPVSKLLAREALRLLGANIEAVVADGSNVDARGAMLLGSMLAGQAFANSPVAAVHALAYPIGGTFHIPHGLSNALVLPHVLRFNAPNAGSVYAEIAADAFPALAEVEGSQARTAAFIDAVSDLSARLGLPQRLRDVNIPQSAIPKMAEDAMVQARLLVNNPRDVTQADAQAIYEAAW